MKRVASDLGPELSKRARHSPELLQRLLGTQHSGQGGSVLMNLLVSGCDVRAGYVCLPVTKHRA
jgi:hypothetical protein